MTRQETTVTERLNDSYKQKGFLRTRFKLQAETFNRVDGHIHLYTVAETVDKLKENQAVIDRLLEDM